jgi:hypothetical protein
MKKTASMFVLIISLAAALLANAGEPTIAPFDSATYDAIYTEAMQAVHKLQAQGEIPKELWGEAITKLKPLRVQDYHGHVMIVLKEDETSEEGLFVSSPISSYNPVVGSSGFLVFETLFKPDDKPTGHKPVDVGFLSHYKSLKANLDDPANVKHPFRVETNSSSSATGQLP